MTKEDGLILLVEVRLLSEGFRPYELPGRAGIPGVEDVESGRAIHEALHLFGKQFAVPQDERPRLCVVDDALQAIVGQRVRHSSTHREADQLLGNRFHARHRTSPSPRAGIPQVEFYDASCDRVRSPSLPGPLSLYTTSLSD